MHSGHNNLMFGKDGERFYLWFRGVREPIMAPIIEFLVRIKIQPDTLTYLGLAMMIPYVYFFSFNPWLSFLFLLLQLFFDGLDGPLARRLGTNSAQGALLDVAADYTSYVVIFFTALFFGLLSPFWAAAHVLSYAVMQSFVFFARLKDIDVFPVARPKMLFYLILFVWLLTAQDFFDPFLVVSTVYLLVSNLFLFVRIKCSL